ncbi:MAG: molybdate ABC transporter substrate-binding protein [Nitrospirae bacterium]|nr:MAG: molybdate ABC transporter substrate-binding protein [Nitrospirota bacterium]
MKWSPDMLRGLLIAVSVFAAVTAHGEELAVSAAMSLKSPFEELGKIYAAQNSVTVRFNFGASGDLARQIEAGAPVDVFAAAAEKDMDELEKKGLLASKTRADFASNAVVLIVPQASKLRMKSFEELRSGNIKRLAVGNPKTTPIGRYTEEVFVHYKLSDALKDKLIPADNVRQILDYTARNEVDAGVVYATDAAVRGKEVKVALTAPEKSHKPVVYPIAVLKGTPNSTAARGFVSFATSPEGRKILEKYGFKALKQSR